MVMMRTTTFGRHDFRRHDFRRHDFRRHDSLLPFFVWMLYDTHDPARSFSSWSSSSDFYSSTTITPVITIVVVFFTYLGTVLMVINWLASLSDYIRFASKALGHWRCRLKKEHRLHCDLHHFISFVRVFSVFFWLMHISPAPVYFTFSLATRY